MTGGSYEAATARASSGGVVFSVEPGGPGARAGVRPGDVVLTVDGAPVRDVIDWWWLTTEPRFEAGLRGEDGERTVVVPGHAIESMWFQIHIARAQGDQAACRRAVEVIRRHLELGWDPQFGARMTGKVGDWTLGALVIDDRQPGRHERGRAGRPRARHRRRRRRVVVARARQGARRTRATRLHRRPRRSDAPPSRRACAG